MPMTFDAALQISVERWDASIVFVGEFNPPIFTPDWLAENGLIGSGDADTARASEELVISPQIARYSSSYFQLQVLRNQLSVQSIGAVTPAISDLAAGIFSLLKHTPIIALGLNFDAHFKMRDVEMFHKIGDVLAPKTIWNTFPLDDHKSFGLETFTMISFPDDRKGQKIDSARKRITVQGSNLVSPGIFLAMNTHVPMPELMAKDKQNLTSSEMAAHVVKTQWQAAHNETEKVFQTLISETLKAGA